MTEATHLHDELMRSLLRLMPKTIYHDPRRLNTLAWAITGLWRTADGASVRLGGSNPESCADGCQSNTAVFRAFFTIPLFLRLTGIGLSCKRLSLTGQLISASPSRLPTTALPPFVLIRSCLVYRGRAIPLAWRAVRHKSTQVSFEAYQPVLDQLGAILPEGHRITLLADRGGRRMNV